MDKKKTIIKGLASIQSHSALPRYKTMSEEAFKAGIAHAKDLREVYKGGLAPKAKSTGQLFELATNPRRTSSLSINGSTINTDVSRGSKWLKVKDLPKKSQNSMLEAQAEVDGMVVGFEGYHISPPFDPDKSVRTISVRQFEQRDLISLGIKEQVTTEYAGVKGETPFTLQPIKGKLGPKIDGLVGMVDLQTGKVSRLSAVDCTAVNPNSNNSVRGNLIRDKLDSSSYLDYKEKVDIGTAISQTINDHAALPNAHSLKEWEIIEKGCLDFLNKQPLEKRVMVNLTQCSPGDANSIFTPSKIKR